MVFYPIQVAIVMFLMIGALMTMSFLAYQSYMISIGRTTYETFKWRELYKVKQQEALLQPSASDPGVHRKGTVKQQRTPAPSSDGAVGLLAKWRQQLWPEKVVIEMPKSIYDKGFWGNWQEVLFPNAFIQQHQSRRPAAKRKKI